MTNRQSCTEYPFTGSFSSETGLRQGVKLFLVLFVLYLRDLEEYLSVNYANHLEFLNGYCMQHIGMYLKLFRLLHFSCKGQTYLFELSIPISYNLDKKIPL
jgi:hypothetical protein